MKIYYKYEDGHKFYLADGPDKGELVLHIKPGYGTLVNLNDNGKRKRVVLDLSIDVEVVNGPVPDVRNEAVIKASCGQKMTLELNEIDKNQDISEVTIRGVTYVPK